MNKSRQEAVDHRRASLGSNNAGVRRSRRGGPADEYHAEALIPPFDSSAKPRPPRRSSTEDASTFLDAEKVFFIHYLRWRVRQGPDFPKKAALYEELAVQVWFVLFDVHASQLIDAMTAGTLS